VDLARGDLRFDDVAVLVGETEMLPSALERKAYDDMGAFLLRILDDPLKEGLDQESATRLFCKSRSLPSPPNHHQPSLGGRGC
jgi:hypothetical protein